MIMSFKPVFGRNSIDASFFTMCAYFCFTVIVITARPFLRFTLFTSPTGTPAMSTVWPWPGITDWAVWNSPLSVKKSVPIPGTQPGR